MLHSKICLFACRTPGKKKKDKLSGLSEHLKKKKHQLDWSSIKILAKENNYWKRRSKEAYFITKHKDIRKINARPFQISGKRFYSSMKMSGKNSFLKFRRI